MFQWLKNLFRKEYETTRKEKIISGAIAFGLIFFFGFLGRMDSAGQQFYDGLVKPDLTPPGWVFPIVWTLLFILIGLSGYLVWNHYRSDRARKGFAILYALNAFAVYFWPYVFFTLQAPDKALYLILGMVIVIECMILLAFRTNHRAAFVLLPYLAWVLFATYLNTGILVLN